MRLSACFTALILLLSGCAGSDPEPIRQEVPEAVRPYFDKFLREGAKRGISVASGNLVVELTGPVQSGSQQVCASTWGEVIGLRQNLIRIDTLCLSWAYGGAEREILVMHELGHALLQRLHRNDRFPSGDRASLMAEQWNIGEFYAADPAKETYYFDELFLPSTPMPPWGE
jgi:hypothetical protein